MTNRQQWTLIAGVVMTAVFGVALAIKLRPQLNLIEIGSTAPDFDAVQLPTGKPVTIEDYRGKVVLLNIWATWCPPCKVEMPSMESLHRKLAGTDFRLVAGTRACRTEARAADGPRRSHLLSRSDWRRLAGPTRE